MPQNNESEWTTWRKSSRSASGDCLEVRLHQDQVQVRHSQHTQGVVLTFTRSEWNAFVVGARLGEFDLPPESE